MKKQCTVAGDTRARPPKVDGIALARDKKMEVPTVGPGRQTLELRNAAKKPRGFDLMTFEPGNGPRDPDRCAEGGEKGKPPAKLLGGDAIDSPWHSGVPDREPRTRQDLLLLRR
jgi:hypothetical protein